MRSFADLDRVIGSVPASVVMKLRAIDVGRGSEALHRDQLPGLLSELAHRARVASITASSAMEGVTVSSATRAGNIIEGHAAKLRTRSEQELAGYRDAQDYLFREDWKPLTSGLVLHLHRLLFAHTASPGGRFKAEDNLVVDRSIEGSVTIRFRPVAAGETDFYVNELVTRYREAIAAGRHHPALLIGLFALDLLVIHPFDDGNGRVARALTNVLLDDQGYGVCRYVSLEQAIARSADEYYQALWESTQGWHEDGMDPWPWLDYFVGTLDRAYRLFTERAAADRGIGSKQGRVRDHVMNHAPEIFRMADIRTALPGISDQTIRLVLDQLRSEGQVAVEGSGRTAAWKRQPSRG